MIFLILDLYYRITRCLESGLYNQWLKMTLYPHRTEIKNLVENYLDDKVIVKYNAIYINNLIDSFMIYSIGILSTFIIICLELFYRKFIDSYIIHHCNN